MGTISQFTSKGPIFQKGANPDSSDYYNLFYLSSPTRPRDLLKLPVAEACDRTPSSDSYVKEVQVLWI